MGNPRLGRQYRCLLCVHFRQQVVMGEPKDYGLCVQAPPRTSSVRWPSVKVTDWCGAWHPLDNGEEDE